MFIRGVLFVLGLFFLGARPAYGEEFNFQKSYADYLYNLEEYQSMHQRYVKAKQAYSTYDTLATRDKAIEAGVGVVLAREEMLRTYLTMLRMRLLKEQNKKNNNFGSFIGRLEGLELWLAGRKDRLRAVSTIDDLNAVSRQLEEKYPEVKLASYQAAGVVLASQLERIIDDSTALAEETKSRLREKEGGAEQELTARSLIQLREKLAMAREKKQAAAKLLASGLMLKGKRVEKGWQEARLLLAEGQQYLRESLNYLEEIWAINER